jgi:hypothetical protein
MLPVVARSLQFRYHEVSVKKIRFIDILDILNKSQVQRYLVFCQDIQISKYLLSINEFASNYPYDDNP